ncbi:MAG: D-2-hydroxyacid dehydrogenase [Anaerolineae bacterium]
MKIIMPEFVVPVLESQACDLLETCDIVVIDNQGQIEGDPEGAEVVMLPWALPQETVERLLGIPTLRWVHTVTAGIDHALQALPPDRDIVVTNASGIFDVPIAEMVLAYMLVIVKRVPEFLEQQEGRSWHQLRLRELAGLTVGIVGLGSIGSEIARRCKAFEMRVIATRRHPERGTNHADEVFPPEGLPTLLARADFVVIAAPLTPETRGLIGTAELHRMREDAWLINIARGPIVDQAALIAALQEDVIAGAALDVFDEERLPADSPLWTLPNVILTPHNSWSTPHLKTREAQLFLDNLQRYLRDEPLRNLVDPSRGY